MLPMDRKKLFDTLFHAYYAKLFFYASGIVGNDGDAEDVVEEVFCDLWTHIDTMEWVIGYRRFFIVPSSPAL